MMNAIKMCYTFNRQYSITDEELRFCFKCEERKKKKSFVCFNYFRCFVFYQIELPQK